MIPGFLGEMEHAHLRCKSIPHPDYLFKTPTHWRMRVEKMRTPAEEISDPTVRAMMLRFAATYDRVAESAGDHAAHDSIMFRSAEVPPESQHTQQKGGPKAAPSPVGLERDTRRDELRRAFVAAVTPLKPSRRPTINCPAAYNAPVVSTMTFCINHANSGFRARKSEQKGGRSRPLAFHGFDEPTPRQRP
jgi:hypothetical protein